MSWACTCAIVEACFNYVICISSADKCNILVVSFCAPTYRVHIRTSNSKLFQAAVPTNVVYGHAVRCGAPYFKLHSVVHHGMHSTVRCTVYRRHSSSTLFQKTVLDRSCVNIIMMKRALERHFSKKNHASRDTQSAMFYIVCKASSKRLLSPVTAGADARIKKNGFLTCEHTAL